MPLVHLFRAPGMVPVWFHHNGGDWGLINRDAVAEVIADCRSAYPDLPEPEVVDDDTPTEADVQTVVDAYRAIGLILVPAHVRLDFTRGVPDIGPMFADKAAFDAAKFGGLHRALEERPALKQAVIRHVFERAGRLDWLENNAPSPTASAGSGSPTA